MIRYLIMALVLVSICTGSDPAEAKMTFWQCHATITGTSPGGTKATQGVSRGTITQPSKGSKESEQVRATRHARKKIIEELTEEGWRDVSVDKIHCNVERRKPSKKKPVPPHLQWGPKPAEAYDWIAIPPGWMPAKRTGDIFDCKFQRLFKWRIDGDIGPLQHIEAEHIRIVGPISHAKSATLRAALHEIRARARGREFVLVDEAGDCWQSGSAKPSMPGGWIGPW